MRLFLRAHFRNLRSCAGSARSAGNLAMTRAFLERLVFPWLRYTDFSCTAPKKAALAWIYTMNAPESMMPDIRAHLAILENATSRALGDPKPSFVEAYSTVQVKDYSRYAMDGLRPDDHLAWHDAHWEHDLEKARDAGSAMAGKIAGGHA